MLGVVWSWVAALWWRGEARLGPGAGQKVRLVNDVVTAIARFRDGRKTQYSNRSNGIWSILTGSFPGSFSGRWDNTASIHLLAAERGFELLSPEGMSSNAGLKKTKLFDKSRFEYDSQRNTYRCPAGKTLHYVHKSRDRHGLGFSHFRAVDCQECPLRAQCNKAKGNRTINRYDHEAAKEALRQKMQQPQAKAKYCTRQTTVEPVFAETKGVQGYVRYRRKRMRGVRLEHSLHSCAHNLRRALRIKLPWTRHDGSGGAWAGRSSDDRSSGPSRPPIWRRPMPGMHANRARRRPGR